MLAFFVTLQSTTREQNRIYFGTYFINGGNFVHLGDPSQNTEIDSNNTHKNICKLEILATNKNNWNNLIRGIILFCTASM